MARVVMTIKIMPEDVDTDLDDLLIQIKNAIPQGTDIGAVETQPLAPLKAYPRLKLKECHVCSRR
jgi:translation elongation factor aEF-1 beta